MTDLRQAAQQALEALEVLSKLGNGGTDGNSVGNTIAQEAREHLFTALAQPQQQAEPVGLITPPGPITQYTIPTQPQAEPVAWDKPSASFNAWWDSYRHDPSNPFAEGSAAYWAWAGWKSPQRQWVGLTDEDFLEACQIAERGNYLVAFQRIQIKLKERNT